MPRKPAATPEFDEVDEGEELSATAVDRLGYMASSAQMSARTLTGDLRDVMLDIIKSRPKPWSATSEEEQMKVIAAIEDAARTLVRGVVEVVCGDGFIDPVSAILEGYTDKGDVKGTFKVKSMDDTSASFAISTLHRMRGKLVLISMASPDDYDGERAPAEADRDQTGLAFEAEDDL